MDVGGWCALFYTPTSIGCTVQYIYLQSLRPTQIQQCSRLCTFTGTTVPWHHRRIHGISTPRSDARAIIGKGMQIGDVTQLVDSFV